MKKQFKFFYLLSAVTFFFGSCEKETLDPLTPPTADAGSFQTVQLPTNNVSLTGSGTTTNGNIVGYLWSLISGPNQPIIESPSSPTTKLKSLIDGTYTFQFAVTDAAGLTGMDTVSILVKAPIQHTITLQPANNTMGGHADSYNLVGGTGGTELPIGSWTINGTPTNWRSFVQFDQSQIPANSTIIEATLYLYSAPNPILGNGDAQYGTANAFYIERITGNWTGATLNWNALPATTTEHRVLVPKSGSTTENISVNVKDIVQDMTNATNQGFAFRLQNETPLNIRVFASSFNSNATLRPKLVITYQ